MSGKFEFEKALRGRKDLSDVQFRILVLLLGYAGSDLAGAHPGTQRLADDACVSHMTARRHLKALQQSGWITVTGTHHSGHGRRGVAKVYAIHVPEHRDQVLTQVNTGSGVDNPGPSGHPGEHRVSDDQVFKSDDQVFISARPSDHPGEHPSCLKHQINTSGPTPAESTDRDDQGDDQAHNGQAHPNGKEHKRSGASPRINLPIDGDESPAELRMKQLRNKGLAPADAIRVLLAERRTAEP